MTDSPKSDKAEPSSSFWQELKRRKVMRVGVTYAVVAWLLIQVSATVFPQLGIPDWAARLVTLLLLIGFPIALIITWAFELTPQGIKTTKVAKEQKAEESTSETFTRKRKWMTFAFGAAVPTLIFGTLALFFFIRSGGDSDFVPIEKSIAVLPFENRSNLDEDQFFTDGIHDDLVTQISRIRDITAKARTSVMGYRNTTKRPKEIGEELGVSWLLEGGVQRGGNQIRINIQLIDPKTEGQIWGESYIRELTAENIFQIQSEISMRIADELKAVLSPEEKESLEKLPTSNLEALEAYFRGKEGYIRRTTSSTQNSIANFEEAISLDPDFALAHLNLGLSLLERKNVSGLSQEEQIAKAEPHILKALELDDRLSEAYRALGVLRFQKREYATAELAYQTAIELDPNNPQAYDAYANLLYFHKAGPTPRVAELMRKAYDVDPKDSLAKDRLAESFEALGQWDRALEIRKSFAEENPDSLAILRDLGLLYMNGLGRIDDAIITFRKQLALDPAAPNANGFLSVAHLYLGDVERAIWWIDRFLESNKDPLRQAWVGAMKFKLQGDDEAREQVILAGLLKFPADEDLLNLLTELYIASGQLEELRTRWERAYPSFFEPLPQINWRDWQAAKDLARVFKATGEEEQANLLIDSALDLLNAVTERPGKYSREAVLYAIVGDDQQTLDAVGRFFDAGGSPYELDLQDELKSILEHREYQAMAEKRKAALAVQLERILRMEANGELPSIPELPGKK